MTPPGADGLRAERGFRPALARLSGNMLAEVEQ
jgi:hypothetical protein